MTLSTPTNENLYGLNSDQPSLLGTGLTGLASGVASGVANTTQPPAVLTTVSDYKVVRRNGSVVMFDPSKIALALTKAFLAVSGSRGAASTRIREMVARLTSDVIHTLSQNYPHRNTFNIEDIQNEVERSLMRADEHEALRRYVLYREERAGQREQKREADSPWSGMHYVTREGHHAPLTETYLRQLLEPVCIDLPDLNINRVVEETLKNVYEGIPEEEVRKAVIMSTRVLLEKDPGYSYAAARLLLQDSTFQVLGISVSLKDLPSAYEQYFPKAIAQGVNAKLLSPQLLTFDLPRLAKALDARRDYLIKYTGMQTLYDRYLLHIEERRIELPQIMFMRVAMGLALNEQDKEAWAIRFYDLMSSLDFMASTPTLFNSGTLHSQLSSCYLTTIPDDLEGIYDGIKDNALLSKFAGGLGNDWTAVRAMDSRIKGTNGKSQGVIPFLKVASDTAIAVNQGGKRKGAVCAYLEPWHLDVEEFIAMRKVTGEERRRTQDMNIALWIPDLFMKRVMENGSWTLFSPSDCPDLHEKYGKKFEEAYHAYEQQTVQGKIRLFKTMPAVDLWRRILNVLYETGHPWITFKDACNIRSPQQHVGVIHSSNLCTEITLNTSANEIAVCNLGSVNLKAHINGGQMDYPKLRKTITVAMRMLDNVIDLNFYPVEKARTSNMRHRPVGLGMMGLQDCLYEMRVPFASETALSFSDQCTEAFCYYAYWASSDLAVERGVYSSFKGSLWDQGIMPHDSLRLLEQERQGYLEVDLSSTQDWEALRLKIARDGMRNSNCVAIAPTATISNITGASPCIESSFSNLFSKSNLSGEFITDNKYLVDDLKRLGLWDDVMISDITHFNGMISKIDRIPKDLRQLYQCTPEIDARWVVEAGARRQKWIDQAQSLNLMITVPSGRYMDELYKLAWIRGLKTTYYCRSEAASQSEKSGGKVGQLNSVSSSHNNTTMATGVLSNLSSTDYEVDCEACQ